MTLSNPTWEYAKRPRDVDIRSHSTYISGDAENQLISRCSCWHVRTTFAKREVEVVIWTNSSVTSVENLPHDGFMTQEPFLALVALWDFYLLQI